MDGCLGVGLVMCGVRVGLNTQGWMGVARIYWGTNRVRVAHRGNGGIVGHLWRLADHWEATEGRTAGQEGWTSLGMRVGHVGRVWSCSGGLEGATLAL